MTIAWPDGVPFSPAPNSISVDPFRAPLITDLDDGNTRQRPSTTRNIATLAFNIPMSNDAFMIFKAWVRDTLVSGTLPFSMPVYDGQAHSAKDCQFSAAYKDNPLDGSQHVVSVSIDVFDY